MGNLDEQEKWEEGIPYFEADALLTGGPDCPDNIPIRALANRTKYLKKQIADAISGALSFEYANRLKTVRSIAMTGDGSWVVTFDGSGNVTSTMTLANTGVAAGTYPVVTIDSKGRVTAARSLQSADLPANAVLSGNPTAPTAEPGTSNLQIANTAYVQAAIAALVASSPAALDTLKELATALGNDPNFATTMTNALAGKAALAGSDTQTFNVANGTKSQHAMALGQMRNKNPILNGGMEIAQRGTSFALQTAWKYGSLDRWAAIQANTAQGVLAQAAAGLPNFSYCAKLGRNNGATSTGFVGMLQALETLDSISLQGKTCTLSFYVKAGANYSGGATFGANVWTGQGTDQAAGNYAAWTNGASAGVSNPVLTAAWQRVTYQVAIPALATQLALIFGYTPSGAAGADDNIYITGVQLEPWPVATDFDRRPTPLELGLCQRYFEKSYSQGVYPGNASNWTGAPPMIGGQTRTWVNFVAVKRIAPAVTFYNPNTGATGTAVDSTNANAAVAVTTAETGTSGFSTSATTTAGHDVRFQWTADAEL